MSERWKDIEGFDGYQVSDQGRVRSFWEREHYPTGHGTYNHLSDTPKMMPVSDDGNGYLKLMLYCKADGKRYCKKLHRLVAEAFIPHNEKNDTVDHIKPGREGKLDNSIGNLRWISRSDNIKKAYSDGMHNNRIKKQNKPIIVIDLWTGEDRYFESIGEAAEELKIDRSSISHVLIGDHEKTSHYTFEYAGREERLLYGYQSY